jgi:hypothetical protein
MHAAFWHPPGQTRRAGRPALTTCRDLRTSPDVSYRALMPRTSTQHAVGVIKALGIARPVEFEARGITRAQLSRLVNDGLVIRQSRGLYTVAGQEPTAEHTLAQVAKRVPVGVLCLLTALRFHGLTTQSPAEVWFAAPEKARRPQLDYPRLRIARFSGEAFTEGVEERRAEGVTLRIYSAAKRRAGRQAASSLLRGGAATGDSVARSKWRMRWELLPAEHSVTAAKPSRRLPSVMAGTSTDPRQTTSTATRDNDRMTERPRTGRNAASVGSAPRHSGMLSSVRAAGIEGRVVGHGNNEGAGQEFDCDYQLHQ